MSLKLLDIEYLRSQGTYAGQVMVVGPSQQVAVTPYLVVTNGNVGIGTSLPDQSLSVAGNISVVSNGHGYLFPDGSFQDTAAVSSAPSSTSGSVQYNDNGHFGGSSNLFWDNVDNRLGLATTTPATTLDVNGVATIRNGMNVVAGGLYVQAGGVNFVAKATAANLVSNGYVQGTSLYSSGPISAAGTITAANLASNAGIQTVNLYATGPINGAGLASFANITSNGYVKGTSINSSGPLSAAGALTASTVTSNGFIFGSSLNTSGTATVNLLISNSSVQGTNIYSSGAMSAAGTITGANLQSNGYVQGTSMMQAGP